MEAKRIVLLAFLGVVMGVVQASGTTWFDPGLKWKTLETPNFSVHYHEGEEELAQEAGWIAEDVHQALSSLMKWKPFTKTQVVLTDNVDFANGMATPFPANTMVLFATSPAGAELDPYEGWLRELITHEYTHILHLDQVGGLWKLLRFTFGRIVLPNAVQPLWLIEGFAVHNESTRTGGGRQRGALFDMMLRVATLEGRLNTLDQAGTFIARWPGGRTPYLYGAMFYRWLADRYGEEKLAEVSRLHSAAVPLLVDLPALVVYGKPWFVLWEEWVSYLENKYEKQKEEIESKPLTGSTPLTRRGYYTSSPTFSPRGDRIAYVEYNADEYPSLRLMELERPKTAYEPSGLENYVPAVRSRWLRQTGDRILLEAPVNPGLSFFPDGEGIAISQRETYKNYYTYDDLYLLDLATGTRKRLTSGLRARDPALSPDGRRIAFVINRLGRNDLALISPDGSDLHHLTHNKDHIQYSLPRFSPDGRWIAVSRWKPGGYQDICLADLAAALPSGEVELRPILEDRAVDLAPCWSPDGEWVLFSSDRSGVFNIYGYSLDEKRLYQVTNVLGGAFSPAVSPDSRSIAFVSYGVNGYDIHLMDLAPREWREAEPYVCRLPEVLPGAPTVDYPSHSYNPIPSLLPRFWLPLPAQDEKGWGIGLVTLGWDALQQHEYSLIASWGMDSQRPAFDFTYLNNMSWPEIGFHGSDGVASMVMTSQSAGDTTYWERRQKGGVRVSLPFLRTSSGQTISLAYDIERLSSLSGLPLDVPRPDTGVLSGVEVSWNYGNAKQYGFGISPTDGRYISLGIRRDDERFFSDFDLTRFRFDWREYLAVPFLRHNVLAARLAGAVSLGDTLTQRSFQLGLGSEFLLRGYPEGRFSGQRALSGSFEYRFPLLWVERGFLTLPFFLRDFEGTAFADWGNAWDADEIPPMEELKIGVGGEVGSCFEVGWLLSLLVKVGFARGVSEGGETQIYFSLGSSF